MNGNSSVLKLVGVMDRLKQPEEDCPESRLAQAAINGEFEPYSDYLMEKGEFPARGLKPSKYPQRRIQETTVRLAKQWLGWLSLQNEYSEELGGYLYCLVTKCSDLRHVVNQDHSGFITVSRGGWAQRAVFYVRRKRVTSVVHHCRLYKRYPYYLYFVEGR